MNTYSLIDTKKMLTNKPKMISSLQNPLVKHCVKLRESRQYREEMQSVFITGHKMVDELMRMCQPKRLFFMEKKEIREPIEAYQVSEAVLKKITGLPSPEGIAAEFPLPKPSALEPISSLIALDRIADPGNLGTLIRTALALGWDGVFLLPGCVDPFHDKTMRASRGALFHFPWASGSWEELSQLKEHNNLTAYVADMHGVPISSLSKNVRPLLLLSNEAQGISKEGSHFGIAISIPMKGEMESLNVAIAGAILMYALHG